MRKYLSLAVVALSSGGALFAAAGAAGATTANDTWHEAPWLGSSPRALHAAPFSHHDEADDNDAICGMQKADYLVGQIDVKLVQKGCITSGDAEGTPSVPGPPPVMAPPPMGSPEPCACAPHPPMPPTPVPSPPPVPCPPPVPTPPPVPCPPPTPTPCPPGEDHGSAGEHHGSSGEEHGSAGEHQESPGAGNAIAGLPILGSAVGGLL